eukprot:COSAG06_NODE_7756_length_2387_cov_4.354458_3_plen_248_part_00
MSGYVWLCVAAVVSVCGAGLKGIPVIFEAVDPTPTVAVKYDRSRLEEVRDESLHFVHYSSGCSEHLSIIACATVLCCMALCSVRASSTESTSALWLSTAKSSTSSACDTPVRGTMTQHQLDPHRTRTRTRTCVFTIIAWHSTCSSSPHPCDFTYMVQSGVHTQQSSSAVALQSAYLKRSNVSHGCAEAQAAHNDLVKVKAVDAATIVFPRSRMVRSDEPELPNAATATGRFRLWCLLLRLVAAGCCG